MAHACTHAYLREQAHHLAWLRGGAELGEATEVASEDEDVVELVGHVEAALHLQRREITRKQGSHTQDD